MLTRTAATQIQALKIHLGRTFRRRTRRYRPETASMSSRVHMRTVLLLRAVAMGPTPTGYVVYRCTQLNACKITAPAGPDTAFFIAGPNANFVIIDGFELAANSYATYGVGVGIGNFSPPQSSGPHHIWVLNNIIHGYGQGGIATGGGEFYYFIHNAIYDNARITCDAQGQASAFGNLARCLDVFQVGWILLMLLPSLVST